jgi:hypothetical protein
MNDILHGAGNWPEKSDKYHIKGIERKEELGVRN